METLMNLPCSSTADASEAMYHFKLLLLDSYKLVGLPLTSGMKSIKPDLTTSLFLTINHWLPRVFDKNSVELFIALFPRLELFSSSWSSDKAEKDSVWFLQKLAVITLIS